MQTFRVSLRDQRPNVDVKIMRNGLQGIIAVANILCGMLPDVLRQRPGEIMAR